MPKEQELEIEVDDNLQDFLEGDSSDASSTKVSFQLDTDGSVIGDDIKDDKVDIAIEGEDDGEAEPEPEPVVEELEENTAEEPEKVPAKDTEAEKKRKSRAKERIKQQNQRIKQLEAALAGRDQELQEIKANFDETTSNYAKIELERLTAGIARMEADLKRAADEGDSTAVASITKELVESQTHLTNLKAMSEQVPTKQEPQKQQAAQQPSLSDAAEDWMLGKEFLLDNNEYKELTVEQRKKLSPVRTAMKTVARELLEEGFANNDPIFYEEMDIRLSEKFDFYEGLASDGLDALEYTKDSEEEPTSNDSSGETEKPQKTNKSKNVPTKGSPRSSSADLTSSKNSNKVVITKEMHNYWKNHLQKYMTLQEYALEVKKDQQRQKF